MTSSPTELTAITAVLAVRVHRALSVSWQPLPREHTADARWPCVCSRGKGEQRKKIFHLDGDALSHPTATNILRREENSMMPDNTQQ